MNETLLKEFKDGEKNFTTRMYLDELDKGTVLYDDERDN